MITPQWSILSYTHMHIPIYLQVQSTEWDQLHMCVRIWFFENTRVYRKKEVWRREEEDRQDGSRKVRVMVKWITCVGCQLQCSIVKLGARSSQQPIVVLLRTRREEFSSSKHKEMINVYEDRNANYTDLFITHWIHALNYYAVPHKSV